MITVITPPMITIWSVDPISDFPSAWGVGVACIKVVLLGKPVCASVGAE